MERARNGAESHAMRDTAQRGTHACDPAGCDRSATHDRTGVGRSSLWN